MLGIISKIFGGNKSEKDVKKMEPIVGKTNQFFQQYQSLSNDELRNKTAEFKVRIAEHLKPIDDEIKTKTDAAEALSSAEIGNRDLIYKEVDALKKDRDASLEKILDEILPEAFATVKETSRRFKENETLESLATDLDRELAIKKDNVIIQGDKAIYKNTWTAAGGLITWNMVHYDVQLIGGAVLHSGRIAEMATGEGKTLVSTLPSYLNALAGLGVHLVTVNDYLARRDSEWNAPIFEWLGVTVDCIDKHEPNSDARRKAYNADVVYGTNNEFGFDYLRDNMVHTPNDMVQRKHHFAMVDEVDSVLIDDARTPLIISGPIGHSDNTQQFFDLKPRIEKLIEVQKKATQTYLIEAKKKIGEGNDDPKDGGLALMRAHRGLPKNGALIKFLSEPGIRVKLQKAENYYLADQQKEMPKVDAELYFSIDEKNNQVELTDKGISLITAQGEDPEFFILPDISTKLADIEKTDLTAEEKLQRKENLMNEYTSKAERIHTAQQLLKAYTLFEKDQEYVVMEDAVKIVDEQTGRILDGRRYSDGLHQAIEAKENVKIEASTQTYATVTLQNYFRMYHKLAGMTGTAETEAAELWSIYKLDVVSIPTNVPVIRKDSQDKVFKTKREKYKAVIDEVEKMRVAGRPSLVGTTSVEISELLSRMMKQKNIPHNVLNAKQHSKEAQVVAEAGMAGAVTIATNMAGRGTDIKLGPGVKDAGGLAIIGTERHESRRVDRQLRGRAGRQGDPGSSSFFVALEDDLMRMFGSERIAGMMDRMGYKEGEMIEHSMITKSIERAQKKVEENNFGIRKRLLEYDDVMNAQREVVYKRRRHALFGERLKLDIANMLYDTCELIVDQNKVSNNFKNFEFELIRYFSITSPVTESEFSKLSEMELTGKIYKATLEYYTEKTERSAREAFPIIKSVYEDKNNQFERIVVPFTDGIKSLNVVTDLKKAYETEGAQLVADFEKNITLSIVDEAWKKHLRKMDELKQSVQLAVHEQKDPLLIYKLEAFNLFRAMIDNVNKEVISFLFKGDLPAQENQQIQEAKEVRQQEEYQLSKDEIPNSESANREAGETQQRQVTETIVRDMPKINRNDNVTIQNVANGQIQEMKYKKAESLIASGQWVIVN